MAVRRAVLLLSFVVIACGPGDDFIQISNVYKGAKGLAYDGQGGSTRFIDRTQITTSFSLNVGALGQTDELDEVMLFSRRGPVVAVPVNWDGDGVIATVPEKTPIRVPIRIRIVVKPSLQATVKSHALKQLWMAMNIFWNERTGLWPANVKFVPVPTSSPPPWVTFGAVSTSSVLDAQAKAQLGWTPKAVNIYYMLSVNGSPMKGAVSDEGSTLIFLGAKTRLTLLAHELGHMLGLGHTDDSGTLATFASIRAMFNSTNVMFPDSTNRAYFTEGQTFRMHFHKESALFLDLEIKDPAGSRAAATHWGSGEDKPDIPAIQLRIWPEPGALAADEPETSGGG